MGPSGGQARYRYCDSGGLVCRRFPAGLGATDFGPKRAAHSCPPTGRMPALQRCGQWEPGGDVRDVTCASQTLGRDTPQAS